MSPACSLCFSLPFCAPADLDSPLSCSVTELWPKKLSFSLSAWGKLLLILQGTIQVTFLWNLLPLFQPELITPWFYRLPHFVEIFYRRPCLSVMREVESQSFLYGYVVEPQVNYRSSLSLSMTICRWRMIIPYSVRLWFLKKIHKKCKEPGRVLGSWKISCIFSIFVFAPR